MENNRPVGVTILAGLQFFYSGFGLLISLALLLIKPFQDTIIDASIQTIANDPALAEAAELLTPDLFRISLLFGAGMGIFFGLIGLLMGFGLLKLKKWAWIGTLILQIFQVLGGLQGLLGLINGSLPAITASQLLFQLVLSVCILFYLFQGNVRHSFGFGGHK